MLETGWCTSLAQRLLEQDAGKPTYNRMLRKVF